MAELSNDLPKELWDKILFTDLINPVPWNIDHDISYIYVDPTNTNSDYIWLLPDGRLIQAYWVYREKGGYSPKQLIYVGEGVFHHKQRKT